MSLLKIIQSIFSTAPSVVPAKPVNVAVAAPTHPPATFPDSTASLLEKAKARIASLSNDLVSAKEEIRNEQLKYQALANKLLGFAYPYQQQKCAGVFNKEYMYRTPEEYVDHMVKEYQDQDKELKELRIKAHAHPTSEYELNSKKRELLDEAVKFFEKADTEEIYGPIGIIKVLRDIGFKSYSSSTTTTPTTTTTYYGAGSKPAATTENGLVGAPIVAQSTTPATALEAAPVPPTHPCYGYDDYSG